MFFKQLYEYRKNTYQNIFAISAKETLKMARLTKGFSFAFQLVGSLKWNNPHISWQELIAAFDENIQELVYEKVWSELSQKDKETLIAIIKSTNTAGEARVKDVRETLKINSSSMSGYRNRLKKKGLIDTSHYGYISLTLPHFENYVFDYYIDD